MVLIPVIFKDDDHKAILSKVKELFTVLKNAGVRVHLDDRDNYNPGWKYNSWELKGVPIRMELGKNDLKNQEVRVVRRDNGSKQQIRWDNLGAAIPELLEQIHHDMYERALQTRDSHVKHIETWQ